MIAQAVAIHHPERVLSLTSIMSTPSNHRGQPLPWSQLGRVSRTALNGLKMWGLTELNDPEDNVAAVSRALEALVQVIGSPAYPMAAERLHAYQRAATDRDHGDHSGVGRQLAAILALPDRTSGLRGVRVPTLVIGGAEDPLVSLDAGLANAEAVPGAWLSLLPAWGTTSPSSSERPSWPRSSRVTSAGEAAVP